MRISDWSSDVCSSDLAARVEAAALAAVGEAAVVVLSDYGKGLLSDALVAAVIAAAARLGRPLVVDPKGRDFRRYRGAGWVTPNRRELQEASEIGRAHV